MKSYSQAGQDLLVAHILDGQRDGRFLEIGCCEPVRLSNTYALETELGWRGLMVDNDPGAVAQCTSLRKSDVINYDTTSPEFQNFLRAYYARPLVLDYLSLDVDSASLDSLRQIPTDLRFRVITIEHDCYRFANGPRDEMREILRLAGYLLIAGDVKHESYPYEDWWVAPDLVDMERAQPFASEGLDWREVLRLGGIET